MEKALNKTFVTSVVLLVIGSLAAFGGGAKESDTKAAGEVKTLSIWSILAEEAFAPVADEYKKTHPNIEFEFLQIPWSNAGWAQKCMTGLLSGQLPDIAHTVQAAAEWSAPVRGVYRSLNPFLEADGMPAPTEPVPIMRVSTLEGQVYGLPLTWDYSLIYYNKKMFSEAGYSKPPKTLDEFLEYTGKLAKKDANGNLEQLGFASMFRAPNQHIGYVMNAGGHFFSSDGRTALHGSKEPIEASKFMIEQKDMQGNIEEHFKLAPRAKGVADPLVRETAAMGFFHAVSQLAQIEKYNPDLEYGATPYPAPAGRTPALIQSGINLLTITSTSDQPREAWEFIKFWYENQLLFVKNSWNIDARMPANSSVARSPEFTSLHPSLPDLVASLDSVAEVGQVIHMFATDIHWMNQAPAVDRAMHGEESPEQAQATAQEKVQEDLDGVWKKLEDRGLEIKLKRW